MRELELFKRIFSDAHLVDIDLSSWDKAASLYVLADHAPRAPGDRLALLAVDFLQPRKFNIEFVHFEFEHLKTQLGPHEHVQWMIDCSKVEKDKKTGTLAISLWGAAAPTPRLSIVCADVGIRSVPHEAFDEVNPTWDQPKQGLARPSIEVLHQTLAAGGRRPKRK